MNKKLKKPPAIIDYLKIYVIMIKDCNGRMLNDFQGLL